MSENRAVYIVTWGKEIVSVFDSFPLATMLVDHLNNNKEKYCRLFGGLDAVDPPVAESETWIPQSSLEEVIEDLDEAVSILGRRAICVGAPLSPLPTGEEK